MDILKCPNWVNLDRYDLSYNSILDVPCQDFDLINDRLFNVQSCQPLVSIIIAAWNEELNLLNCISSLSKQKSKFPFEIIVVNNNSTDNTQYTVDHLNIRGYFQNVQGCGPARQLGQENAKGKYILLADADCIYPKNWINALITKLESPNVVCVYGRYSFIDEPGFPRWKLFLYEKMKDVIAEVRHIKRPYLNAYGISMGYIKDLGLKIGYVNYKIWGDDGRLCFDLMNYGKVKQVKLNGARVWTSTRTLKRDGDFIGALKARIKLELGRFVSLFSAHPPHDTKTSKNQ